MFYALRKQRWFEDESKTGNFSFSWGMCLSVEEILIQVKFIIVNMVHMPNMNPYTVSDNVLKYSLPHYIQLVYPTCKTCPYASADGLVSRDTNKLKHCQKQQSVVKIVENK